jgi:hypothetical protein
VNQRPEEQSKKPLPHTKGPLRCLLRVKSQIHLICREIEAQISSYSIEGVIEALLLHSGGQDSYFLLIRTLTFRQPHKHENDLHLSCFIFGVSRAVAFSSAELRKFRHCSERPRIHDKAKQFFTTDSDQKIDFGKSMASQTPA